MIVIHSHRYPFGMAQGFKALCLSCLVGASFLLPVPAQAQTDQLNARLDRIENEMNTLNRAVYKGEAPPPGAFDASAGTANLEVRLQELESQIRDLTGRIEQQGYDIEQLKNQMEMVREAARSAPPPSSAPQQQQPSPYVDPYPAQPQPPSPAPTGMDDGYEAPAPRTLNEDPAPPMGIKTANPAISSDPTGQYEQAFSYLKAGDYGAAEQGFQSFLDKNPGHALSANAIYWLGESFYVRGQFDKASKVFAEAYQKYPGGPKGADNLLKLGMSLGGAGKKKDACIALAQLSKEYPNGPAPILRRAEQEMASLDCR